MGQNFWPSASLSFKASVSSAVFPVRRSDRIISTYFSMSSAAAIVGTASAVASVKSSGTKYHFLTCVLLMVSGFWGRRVTILAGAWRQKPPAQAEPPLRGAPVPLAPALVESHRGLYCAAGSPEHPSSCPLKRARRRDDPECTPQGGHRRPRGRPPAPLAGVALGRGTRARV